MRRRPTRSASGAAAVAAAAAAAAASGAGAAAARKPQSAPGEGETRPLHSSAPGASFVSGPRARLRLGRGAEEPARSSGGSDAVQAAHVGAQRVRHEHRAVGLLVVLQYGRERAANGQAGAVQGVRVARALAGGGTELQAHTAGLE